jgi:large subunit ribosomal protein L46
MNTWIVGRTPVAHYVAPPVHGPDAKVEQKGEKIFFMKGRIMAGQADLSGNSMDLQGFRWLTKDELQKELPEKYFHSVKGMMDER